MCNCACRKMVPNIYHCHTFILSYRYNSASPEKPAVPHTLSQFHLFAVISYHFATLSHLHRGGLGEGLTSPLLHSTAVLRGVLQMIALSVILLLTLDEPYNKVKLRTLFVTIQWLLTLCFMTDLFCDLQNVNAFTWYKGWFGFFLIMTQYTNGYKNTQSWTF